MIKEVHEKLSQHQARIETMERLHNDIISTSQETNAQLKDLTKSLNEFTTKLAVFDEKSAAINNRIDKLESVQDEHMKAIASFTPVIDGLRGIVGKVIGSLVVSVVASSSIIAFVMKSS